MDVPGQKEDKKQILKTLTLLLPVALLEYNLSNLTLSSKEKVYLCFALLRNEKAMRENGTLNDKFIRELLGLNYRKSVKIVKEIGLNPCDDSLYDTCGSYSFTSASINKNIHLLVGLV